MQTNRSAEQNRKRRGKGKPVRFRGLPPQLPCCLREPRQPGDLSPSACWHRSGLDRTAGANQRQLSCTRMMVQGERCYRGRASIPYGGVLPLGSPNRSGIAPGFTSGPMETADYRQYPARKTHPFLRLVQAGATQTAPRRGGRTHRPGTHRYRLPFQR